MKRGFTTKRESQKRNSDFSFANERREKTRFPGFTLIEVVVTVALSAILVLAIVQLYVVYGRVITLQQSSINIALGGGGIMDAVHSAGLQADHIVTAHAFSGVDYNSGTTMAIFELPAIDASGAVIAAAYDYIGITASGTSAYRFVDAAPGSSRISGTKRLTGALDALNFSYDNASFPLVTSFTADATTSATTQGGTRQMHLRQHIYLRNL